ncbi:MAG: hypothetical protein ACTS4T_00480 [Candidatus Hodgkinia cicadicola]
MLTWENRRSQSPEERSIHLPPFSRHLTSALSENERCTSINLHCRPIVWAYSRTLSMNDLCFGDLRLRSKTPSDPFNDVLAKIAAVLDPSSAFNLGELGNFRLH